MCDPIHTYTSLVHLYAYIYVHITHYIYILRDSHRSVYTDAVFAFDFQLSNNSHLRFF
jgi:hypothetical protein